MRKPTERERAVASAIYSSVDAGAAKVPFESLDVWSTRHYVRAAWAALSAADAPADPASVMDRRAI